MPNITVLVPRGWRWFVATTLRNSDDNDDSDHHSQVIPPSVMLMCKAAKKEEFCHSMPRIIDLHLPFFFARAAYCPRSSSILTWGHTSQQQWEVVCHPAGSTWDSMALVWRDTQAFVVGLDHFCINLSKRIANIKRLRYAHTSDWRICVQLW